MGLWWPGGRVSTYSSDADRRTGGSAFNIRPMSPRHAICRAASRNPLPPLIARWPEIRAAADIRQHKWLLYSMRLQKDPNTNPFASGEMKHTYEPGREHYTPEGKQVIATEIELLYVGDDGAITRRPNQVARHFEITIPPQNWKELLEGAVWASQVAAIKARHQLR
jgi:hypothetical protein